MLIARARYPSNRFETYSGGVYQDSKGKSRKKLEKYDILFEELDKGQKSSKI